MEESWQRESGHRWGGRGSWGLVRGFVDLGKECEFYLNRRLEAGE